MYEKNPLKPYEKPQKLVKPGNIVIGESNKIEQPRSSMMTKR